jgi:hypothetical protein
LKLLKYILLLIVALTSTISIAEVVVLNTGLKIQGEIVLQNDDVVIIKKKDGSRYQYPTSEVQLIQKNDSIEIETEEKHEAVVTRPVALRIQANGGAVYLPSKGWGGQIGVDLQIGSREITDLPLFVGGSIGFRTKILPESNYTFIPLQLILNSPLTTNRHAPYLGMNIGYGFATDKQTKGGICLGISTGWMHHINNNASIWLGCYAEWQQARVEITETINDQDYMNTIGCNFVSIGAKTTIAF